MQNLLEMLGNLHQVDQRNRAALQDFMRRNRQNGLTPVEDASPHPEEDADDDFQSQPPYPSDMDLNLPDNPPPTIDEDVEDRRALENEISHEEQDLADDRTETDIWADRPSRRWHRH
jgi:hypothetical protein